jgi:hypothetical protein
VTAVRVAVSAIGFIAMVRQLIRIAHALEADQARHRENQIEASQAEASQPQPA